MSETEKLKWQFDVSTFRLLGRELITDRITAIYELVKNTYDANAENVYIEFKHVEELIPSSQIILSDDGIGMGKREIKNNWMVIGTPNKRNNYLSPPPHERRLIGEKGVGRFAVDKLGSYVQIKTKQKANKELNILEIDWVKYETLETKTKNRKLFTEVENDFSQEPSEYSKHGTEIIISQLRDVWLEEDLRQLKSQLSKLVSPFISLKPPFNIYLKAKEYAKFQNLKIENRAIRFSTHEFNLTYNLKRETQEELETVRGKIKKKKNSINDFGPIQFDLYYFDQEDKAKFKRETEDELIDGIKIYRDGIITTPFAEENTDQNTQRDILGIDKRRYSGFFDKVSSRDFIGIIRITKEHNPNIKDATNRQDFVNNQEYRDLKEFIITQLSNLETFLKEKRKSKDKKTNIELKKAGEELKEFQESLKKLSEEEPSLKAQIEPIEEQARKISSSIKKGVKTQRNLQKESERKEQMLLSMMSLQDYAANMSHLVRTSLSKIKRMAEFFKNEFPNKQYNKQFALYAKSIYEEMISLDNAVGFMLGFSQTDLKPEKIDLAQVLEHLFELHKPLFNQEKIKSTVRFMDSPKILSNRKFFEDIIENLISNSIKALKEQKTKKIKCTGNIIENRYEIVFSDNGPGIPKKSQSKVFNPFYTTTASLGGAGLGLYVVKSRMDAMKGTISIIPPDYDGNGTSFCLTFPILEDTYE